MELTQKQYVEQLYKGEIKLIVSRLMLIEKRLAELKLDKFSMGIKAVVVPLTVEELGDEIEESKEIEGITLIEVAKSQNLIDKEVLDKRIEKFKGMEIPQLIEKLYENEKLLKDEKDKKGFEKLYNERNDLVYALYDYLFEGQELKEVYYEKLRGE